MCYAAVYATENSSLTLSARKANAHAYKLLNQFVSLYYIHLYSPERQQQQVKKSTKHTQQKQTNKREKKTTLKSGRLVNSVTTNEL